MESIAPCRSDIVEKCNRPFKEQTLFSTDLQCHCLLVTMPYIVVLGGGYIAFAMLYIIKTLPVTLMFSYIMNLSSLI